MIKKILIFLFKPQMEILEERQEEYIDEKRKHIFRNYVAEQKLQELGYKLVLNPGSMAKPYGSPTEQYFEYSNWDIEKIDNK